MYPKREHVRFEFGEKQEYHLQNQRSLLELLTLSPQKFTHANIDMKTLDPWIILYGFLVIASNFFI